MGLWHLAIADNHAGSPFGLRRLCDIPTVPFKKSEHKDWSPTKLYLHNRLREQQRDFSYAVKKLVSQFPKFDTCFVLSDTIEGSKDKEGGAELTTTDTSKQEDIAVGVLSGILDAVGNPKVYGVRGTGFHVRAKGGRESDDGVFNRLPNMQAYDDVLFVKAGGLIWKMQHFVARSNVPYGKQGPLSKQIIQNTLGASMDKEFDADVILFGHVHYCVSAGFPMSRKVAYTCPALKLRGEAYGRQYNDFYDVGFLFWKQDKEGAPLQEHRAKIETAYQKPKLWVAQ